ncbi:MAG TPA: sialidase family protein [Bryobacteraceae bacterium]|jgi:sialidase-1|nr:sialidase family protein [Bryobacteraceae bacterium]
MPQAKQVLLCALSAALLHGGRVELSQSEVFRSGQDGYHTYRIPALITTSRGTLLAFVEGRRQSRSDSGDIDLLLKRSFDRGKTWSKAQVIADLGADTIGNPAPVVDRRSGGIILLLTRNPGEVTEKQIIDSAVETTRTVWISRSADDGATWTPPVEITASVKEPEWTWYATGPGAGIQLESGRLVIPCDHIVKGSKARHSHVIYSDDRGKSWKIGGIADEKTNESAVAELRDGSLLLNMRSYQGDNRRRIAISRDAGLTFSKAEPDPALIEPVCQASLIRAVRPGKKSDGRLLFSNPAALKRVRMTVRLSPDDGKTWPVSRVLHEGPAAYSSLAVLNDGTIGILYERGEHDSYEQITFARFPLAWLSERR